MGSCHAIDSWTFCGLVGAFLDLFLAYCLLCGSTLAFFASKFLSFFGLNLPCPCNGLFGYPNNPNCFQKLLVDLPTNKISSVQLSVTSKFPFDSILMKDPPHHRHRMNAQLVKDGGYRSYEVEEDEASCSSSSDVRVSKKNDVERLGLVKSLDGKGKGVFNQRRAIRRRRRAVVDTSRRFAKDASLSSKEEHNFVYWNYEEDGLQDDKEAQSGNELSDGMQHSFQFSDVLGESKNMEKDESSFLEGCNGQQVLGFDRNEEDATRLLEQALEEEHAARSALYQELVKERSAAASAADEAMAMIFRLQEEKATIAMESRQYQRMIEEKSAYDEEEMNILKEILVRREREKHFLEKEVKAFRLLMNGNEEGEGSFYSSEDPELMLRQISESIIKKETVKSTNKSDYNVMSGEKQGRVLVYGEEASLPGYGVADGTLKRGVSGRSLDSEQHTPHGPTCMDESSQEFQEKEMVSVKELEAAAQGQERTPKDDSENCKLYQSEECCALDKTVSFSDERQEESDNVRPCQEMGMKTDCSSCETYTVFQDDSTYLGNSEKDRDQGRRYQHRSTFEAELSVLDVHVIDDKAESSNQGIQKERGSIVMETTPDRFSESIQSEDSGFRRISVSSDHPSTSAGDEPEIHKSGLDMSTMSDKSHGKLFYPDLRGRSLSAVERLKLENEVEWLRGRLKVVQEGREKLSFSVEHRDRETLHLRLLEDITGQLQEIRQLTEPGKAIRQASLPPSSSKAASKKRRCRSISRGVHGSS